jgi:hypothetical protein
MTGIFILFIAVFAALAYFSLSLAVPIQEIAGGEMLMNDTSESENQSDESLVATEGTESNS